MNKKGTVPFNGFSQKTLDFLFENRLKNSKTWFEEHRGEYETYVLEPLRALVVNLTPVMLSIDPLFTVEPAVNKTISRIYRDVRFSRDKSLFRDEMWITFMRNKRFWAGLPGYYFLLGQGGFSYGFGYYEATTESMAIFRDCIMKNDRAFQKALAAYQSQTEFQLSGEKYKRSKFPGQPEEVMDWLDRKNISFDHHSNDLSTLFSPRLADELSTGFQQLKPIYDFIFLVEQKRRRD